MLNTILSKIAKLLALSQSANEHEAALAGAKAQELMLEHKLSASDLVDPTTKEPITEDWVRGSLGAFKYMTWKGSLLYGIAGLNSCTVLKYDGSRLKLIGRDTDRQAVEYLACFLIREIERLAFENFAGAGFNGNSKRWTWVQSFGMGATSIVLRRMREEKTRIVTENTKVNALVKLDDQALARHMAEKYRGTRKTKSSTKMNTEAYMNGRAAGHNVQWNSAVNPASQSRRIA